MNPRNDEYGEVLNGQENYELIARILCSSGSTIFGWTDQDGSHLDILLTYKPFYMGGGLQGGLKPNNYLFVSIMRYGHAFGFDIYNVDTHMNYYSEKLNLRENNTIQELSDLLNGVKKALVEMDI